MAGQGAGPLGSRLLGQDNDSSFVLRLRVQTLVTTSVLLANLIGVLVVGVVITWVLPGPSIFTHDLRLVNFVAVPVYVFGALGTGLLVGTVRSLSTVRWFREDREPTDKERRDTLALPARLQRLQAVLWFVAAAVFTSLYGVVDTQHIAKVGVTVLFGGLVVGGYSYLLTEFSLRPVAAKALATGAPRGRRAGVTARSLMIWALACGLPVIGLMIVSVDALARGDVSADRMAVTGLSLGAVTLAFGLPLTWLGVSSTVAPIRLVRKALAAVEAGDLETRVIVFDGSELGELQVGFNRMAQGLGEREQLRDLFGRHVGRDVAEAAMRRAPELGGEEREVAVFFIDLIGSTALAATSPPAEVVALLNRFLSIVVEEVQRHDGFINKFEGDGALAVFGAPADLDDPAGKALAAARCIQQRLSAELPECQAAAGVAAGRAVAGNVGHERRFEYTVIGDPVNEAARLAELAKSLPGRLVASSTAVERASEPERDRWRPDQDVLLRGRESTTKTAVPDQDTD